MARGWIHTVHINGSWFNETEGAAGRSGPFTNKTTAIAAGRRTARSMATEHVIHNLDGTIAGRNSYGRDPYPPLA